MEFFFSYQTKGSLLKKKEKFALAGNILNFPNKERLGDSISDIQVFTP